MYIQFYFFIVILTNTRGKAAFGDVSLALRESAVFGAHLGNRRRQRYFRYKKKSKIRAPSVPHIWSYNFRRAMKIPNMCLVLKFDNGKVVL